MGDFARNFSPQTPITPISPEPIPEPQPIRFHTAPPAVAPVVTEPPAAPVADGRTLTVSLAELSAAWPEPVQKEITLRQLSAATMHLPVAMIEVAIKQGKVALPWRVLRSWVQPAGLPGASTYDAMVLELPLKVITPLFLADLKTGKRQKKIVIDPTIPDLFSGGAPAENDAAVHRATDEIAEVEAAAPAPAPAPARTSTPGTMFLRTTSLPPMPLPVEPPPLQKGNTLPVNSGLVVKKPQDTNYFGKEPAQAAEDVTEPLVKQGGSLSTAFLNRYATPNEIVAKAMAIEGVDGALIALPDGLLVASQIPPTMNAETVAAFLPQLYGKVSQCTKELRLGDLNNINFTVGQIPWKIYKVGAIYFAAFGRAGEPLPTAQIAAVVGELDRNGK
jgi:predicted regulator of Ras-like GTPase activity (Roadblock/LC7/MglB family)